MSFSPGLCGAWPGAATRFVALRLLPDEDLRAGIEAAFAAAPEPEGFVAAAAGSLGRARLRLAGCDGAAEVAGPLEIVALSGTPSPDGPHLHLAVAGADGAVTGGHLLAGCAVRTTAELVLGFGAGIAFARVPEAQTGRRELVIRPDDRAR